jgi:hypothetical protein
MDTMAMPASTEQPVDELLDLGVEELDDMVEPGFWEWVAGIGVGTALGAGALYLGVAAAT